MVVLGVVGALIAARRPMGFMDVPVPALQFLLIPLTDMALFGGFATLGFANRHDTPSHKRYMLLASIGLLDAAVGRWPFAIMTAELPVPGFSTAEVLVDLYLLPMVAWDLATRGRPHAVTVWGGLAVIASQPLRSVLSESDAWLTIAGWAVRLLGR
jgi:hypothetical protein